MNVFVSDGCCCVVVNGEIVAEGSQFSLKDVEVVVAQVDLDAIMYHSPKEEIAFGPGCWLWDYLRRSGASGFLLPLSGGTDSSSVAAIVGCMCQLVVKEITKDDEQVKSDAIRIGNYTDVRKPQRYELRVNCACHSHCTVDGGSNVENLGLQNIQGRVRMVLAFMLASLLPWVHNKKGFYLVLGSSNVDEALRGYLTKDLRTFLRWPANHLGYQSSAEIEAAPHTAELEPIRSNYSQLDEVDMGMTYEELSVYGRLRKVFRCGPISMFKNLCYKWGATVSPTESYSPEDNRFDLRQFLYNARWPFREFSPLSFSWCTLAVSLGA
ncbi:hypothetical protein REPUB_Repub13aG0014000 [Reevesia pubescens]